MFPQEITSILRESPGVANGTEDTGIPMTAFEETFVSSGIGCYSHQVFFTTPREESGNHQSTNNEVSIICYTGPVQRGTVLVLPVS
jgi:hypothetical protein